MESSLELVSALFTTRVGVKLFLAIVEAWGKRSILLPEHANYPPETTSGVYSRVFFWWQNALFRNGFKNNLKVDDLFDLDKHLRSEYLYQLIQSKWESCEYMVVTYIVRRIY
jgi:ATP-binding cassette subfamily C (CFTR/MRP) protein 1